MSYSVKPAAQRHLTALPNIERAATSIYAPEDLPHEALIEMVSSDQFEEAQRNDRLWVATDEQDRPVGFLIADLVDATLHIREMDVHPDHARRGLGATLLRHVLLEAEHAGHTSVTLTTFSHVPWNGPFYRSNGFTEIDAAQLGPGLADRLSQERGRGLRNRVAMRRLVRRAERAKHWGDA